MAGKKGPDHYIPEAGAGDETPSKGLYNTPEHLNDRNNIIRVSVGMIKDLKKETGIERVGIISDKFGNNNIVISINGVQYESPIPTKSESEARNLLDKVMKAIKLAKTNKIEEFYYGQRLDEQLNPVNDKKSIMGDKSFITAGSIIGSIDRKYIKSETLEEIFGATVVSEGIESFITYLNTLLKALKKPETIKI